MLVVHLNLKRGFARCRQARQQIHHRVGHAEQPTSVVTKVDNQIGHIGLFKKRCGIRQGGETLLRSEGRIDELAQMEIAHRGKTGALNEQGLSCQRWRGKLIFGNGNFDLGIILNKAKVSDHAHLTRTKNLFAGRLASTQFIEGLKP